jgi:hypothetical protein
VADLNGTRHRSLSTWFLRCALGLCLAGYVFVYASGRAENPIRSDGFSYYVYLPSWFLFHDTTLSTVAHDCCGGVYPAYTAIIRWPSTRKWVNAHPIGVAVMQSPFFVAAHLLTLWTNLSPDGFTLYYQHAVGLSGLLWTVAGLVVLRRVLRRHFSEGISTATLAIIFLGTNLYHYATFDSSYSHPYSFFLFAAFLDLTEQWYQQPRQYTSFLLGLVAGLIVLTRHTNALVLVFLPLYGVNTVAAVRARAVFLAHRMRLVAIIAVTATIAIAPQLVIYYRATGHVLVSSYGDLGFNFASPHLVQVLFSVQKGVFFWSPLLLTGCVGLAWLARSSDSARGFVLPAALFLTVNTYLIASWWDWQFGGSYGHRGFVDSLPIFAIGIAAFLRRCSARPRRQRTVTVVVVLAVALNLFQMMQYWNHVLPFSDTTWDQYRAAFSIWR